MKMNNILKSITEKEYIFQLIEENPNRIINNENMKGEKLCLVLYVTEKTRAQTHFWLI